MDRQCEWVEQRDALMIEVAEKLLALARADYAIQRDVRCANDAEARRETMTHLREFTANLIGYAANFAR